MPMPAEAPLPMVPAYRKNLPLVVLDDDPETVEVLTNRLDHAGFPVTGMTDPTRALEAVGGGAWRAAVVDVKMPDLDGLAFLQKAMAVDPGLYVLLITGYYAPESAVDAVKCGAYDYLAKPVDFSRLIKSLDELAQLFTVRTHIHDLEEQLLPHLEFHGIFGKSPAMLEVFDLARKVAKHYTNVLVSGPTGSGKELIARAIHQMSPVSGARIAVCNCSALVDTLVESQLFGHVRGAFTGAIDTRAGLFEYADGGTVFLDEVAEMSVGMQAKLLRVIQNREIQRVGSQETRRVNVRLIAATNRNLRNEVAAGRFREDLYYRLSSMEIRVPGLAERAGDIPILVRHFLKKYGEAYNKHFRGLTRRAQMVLLSHDWRGNVRELENVISSAAITASGEFIHVSDLPEHMQNPPAAAFGGDESWRPLPLAEVRRIHIQKVLEVCNGNRVRAARLLGIGRTSLYRYLRRSPAQAKAAGSSD